jgi:putative endopeptidase
MKKNTLTTVLYGGAMLGMLASCTKTSSTAEVANENDQPIGINTALMDTTVNPGDDFFMYVNGTWIKNTEIPGDQGRWGSFNELREYNQDILLGVLEEAANSDKYAEGSDERKAANFYAVGMDSLKAEQQGLQPIQSYLDQIESISTLEDLQKYAEREGQVGGGTYYGLAVYPDLKNSKEMAAYVWGGSLGLPERDYYLNDDAKSVETRQEYVKHVTRMLEMLGESNAPAKANNILAMETELAQSMLSKEERRNPYNTYNKMAVSELGKLAPSVNWNAYFSGIGAKKIDTVIVSQPKYIQAYEKLVTTRSIDEVKSMLKWNLLNGASPYLSHKFVQADFDFYSKYLRDVQEMRPRWKRVMGTADGSIGEAIGKLYVDKTFPPEAKESAMEMVDNIKLAFGDRIRNLEWMSADTKEKALKKLSTFTVKIGYPDKWTDYSNLEVKTGDEASYFGNMIAGRKFAYQKDLDKLGKPVDKTEWGMTPQTVNAYYNPLFNEIVFPAGILQPPFYDYRADAAVNYGGIGAVIGHEISHGFDDQGSRFDAEGNLSNWWTSEDSTMFYGRTGMLVDQFDAYSPLDSVFVSGQFTLGENIGDLGGVAAAYDGLQLYLKKNGNPGKIDGFTPEQRFFISWATIWRMKYRPETLRTQVKTDPHSPAMYRANGPLSNMQTFYDAFDVEEGDAMWKPEDERVIIW